MIWLVNWMCHVVGAIGLGDVAYWSIGGDGLFKNKALPRGSIPGAVLWSAYVLCFEEDQSFNSHFQPKVSPNYSVNHLRRCSRLLRSSDPIKPNINLFLITNKSSILTRFSSWMRSSSSFRSWNRPDIQLDIVLCGLINPEDKSFELFEVWDRSTDGWHPNDSDSAWASGCRFHEAVQSWVK